MSGLEGLLRGRVLGGRYRIEEVIGRGGMGAVYRALDERLGRRVAVKVITVAMGDDPDTRRRVRARFHREARAAAALPHHPNVVPVYDYGTDAELGLDYIVMELLQGHDLATRLQRAGPPPLPTALRILREAARGLAVGHRAGLVHRDVKPGNIFLARDHDELQVRMVDFGIAKLADDEDSTANQLTQDGRIPHSPAYASPEQLRGLTQLSAASDVFSLGAVGFQLLTGERPFAETDRNRMSLGLPAPVPSLRSRNESIPVGVEEIIQKALSFDPADRFPDASAMVAALDKVLRELPDSPIEPYAPLPALDIPAPPDPEHAPFVPDDDERTQLMDDDAPVFALEDEDDRTQLMDGPAAPPARHPPMPAQAVTPADRSPVAAPRRRRRTALWVWTFVLLALAAVGAWAVMSMNREPRLVDQLPRTDSLAPDTAAPPQDSAPKTPRASDLNREGIVAFGEHRYSDALSLFQRALAFDPTNAEYRQNVGITLFDLGQVDAAKTELMEAVQRNPNLDRAHAMLAQALLAQGDTTGAQASLQQYLNRTSDPVGRARASALMRQLQIEQRLLGTPVDTAPPPNPGPSATTAPSPRDTAR